MRFQHKEASPSSLKIQNPLRGERGPKKKKKKKEKLNSLKKGQTSEHEKNQQLDDYAGRESMWLVGLLPFNAGAG